MAPCHSIYNDSNYSRGTEKIQRPKNKSHDRSKGLVNEVSLPALEIGDLTFSPAPDLSFSVCLEDHLRTCFSNNYGDRVRPQDLGLCDPFQMAIHGLYMGVTNLNTYDTWDDPPSSWKGSFVGVVEVKGC